MKNNKSGREFILLFIFVFILFFIISLLPIWSSLIGTPLQTIFGVSSSQQDQKFYAEFQKEKQLFPMESELNYDSNKGEYIPLSSSETKRIELYNQQQMVKIIAYRESIKPSLFLWIIAAYGGPITIVILGIIFLIIRYLYIHKKHKADQMEEQAKNTLNKQSTSGEESLKNVPQKVNFKQNKPWQLIVAYTVIVICLFGLIYKVVYPPISKWRENNIKANELEKIKEAKDSVQSIVAKYQAQYDAKHIIFIMNNKNPIIADLPHPQTFISFDQNSQDPYLRKNQVVLWFNNDNIIHKIKIEAPQSNDYVKADTVKSGEFPIESSDIPPGDVFFTSFKEGGIYNFYCSLHPQEQGGFIVFD